MVCDQKLLIINTGFINFIQGLFQDLKTKFKEFIFSGTYIIVSQNIAFAQSWQNTIPVSANNILKVKDSSYFRVEYISRLKLHIPRGFVGLEGAEEYT